MSPPKSKKSSTPWYSCEKCYSLLTQKDIPLHEENCPPSKENWNHNYIINGVLYSNLDLYKSQEPPKNITQREINDFVFVAQSAMQLCEISIGDPVLLTTSDNKVVKTAWPTNEKTLTSVSLTKQAIDLNKLEGRVIAERLRSDVRLAKEITLEYIGSQKSPKLNGELKVLIKNCNERRIFTIGNKVGVPFYGRKLVYRILDIKGEEESGTGKDGIQRKLEKDFDKMNLSEESFEGGDIFYKAIYATNWIVKCVKEENEDEEIEKTGGQESVKTSDIAGYDELIAEIKSSMDIALGRYKTIKGFHVTRGILLYGTLGVGKSMIAKALMAESGARLFKVSSCDISSKYVGESEEKLREIFADAKRNSPSIVFIDDLHSICSKKNGGGSSDQDKRILSTLLALFDDLQNSKADVLILATSSQPHSLDPALRRPGRIDREFEVAVPTHSMRREILTKLLSKISHDLGQQNIAEIAFVTHGFVAADLLSLCSRAAMNAVKRRCDDNDCVILSPADFDHALTSVSPSAMKEVLVEVPNVKWSDIGGQKDLKLKLQQAVEWPLKHPEAFVRLGITPPRGVLMFGPPGCSKTMIAKALATESQLNFFNIKGPELFSKWVGESERAVREVFRKARQVAPSIIFIDEIDALGGERASGTAAGSNVQERVLAQLLTELDGVTELGNVTLVAATNRPDRIDKALLRPGRLDRIVYVPLPDFETRKEIFNIKLGRMPVSGDVDVNDLVDLTEGYSGAEVQAICHEAAMKALEENLDAVEITKEHFKAALSIVTPRTPASLIKLYEDYLNKK